MIDKLNGTSRWVAIALTVFGMGLGSFIYIHNTFETKAEAAKDTAYINQHLMDIKADVREIKFDFKQFARRQ